MQPIAIISVLFVCLCVCLCVYLRVSGRGLNYSGAHNGSLQCNDPLTLPYFLPGGVGADTGAMCWTML